MMNIFFRRESFFARYVTVNEGMNESGRDEEKEKTYNKKRKERKKRKGRKTTGKNREREEEADSQFEEKQGDKTNK